MARFIRYELTGMYRLRFEALDGDIEKLSFADPMPKALKRPLGDLEPRDIYGGGAPVSLDNMPTRMRLSGRKAQLHDLVSAYHIFLVNRRFIEVVERFQSDIQCIPVDCTWKDGTPAGERFFFFTTVMLDAVVREKTSATWAQVRPDKGLWLPDLHSGQTFTFDKSRLGGAQMWVDPNMPEQGALVSEQLWAALREAGIESIGDCPLLEEI